MRVIFPLRHALAAVAVPAGALVWLGFCAHTGAAAGDPAAGAAEGRAAGAVALLGLAASAAAWWAGARAVSRWRRAVEARLGAIVERSAVGITVLGPDGRIVESNAAFAELVGRPREALLGVVAATLSPDEERAVTRDLVRDLRAGACDRVEVEKRFVRPDGETRWGRLVLSTIALAQGQGLVGVVQDVTDRKALEARLAHDALHDRLTELPNRALLVDRAAQAMARAARRDAPVVALLVDLDGFRRVNEALGQAAGDALLAALALRLRHATRGADTVARVGGDEFAILLEGTTAAADVARVTRRVREALGRPFEAGGTPVVLRACIGVASAAPGGCPDALLRDAAVAVARAKRLGGDRTVHFDEALARVQADELALEAELRAALAEAGAAGDGACQFRLHFQPIVALGDEPDPAGAPPAGVEALVRWQHPARGLVPPAAFVPLAEETGLVGALGAWVLRAAVRQQAAWRAALGGAAPGYVSVNVAAAQLHDDDFAAQVEAALAAGGLPPEALLLEITESALVRDTDAALATLRTLRALGVRLAVDDFGTGYSSLGYLQQFPVDVLKIDKRFVGGLCGGGPEAALAHTVVAMGRSLGLATVAEGVETAEQAAALRAAGCDYAQGYRYSRPRPAAELAAGWGAEAVAA